MSFSWFIFRVVVFIRFWFFGSRVKIGIEVVVMGGSIRIRGGREVGW